LACLLLVPAAPALAQSGANVLLVVNEASADSGRIAEHYARARSVPSDQVLRVKVDAVDEIERAVFDAQIQGPIATWLKQHAAQDRILYIVLTKGIPLRVRGSLGRGGTVASVDSELTLLYRRLVGSTTPVAGLIDNPCFLGRTPVAQAKPFSHQVSDLYLVTRLDGYTVEDVLGLIDRGAAPVREGRILLDQKAGLDDPVGNQWLKAAADILKTLGFGERVVNEATEQVLSGEKNVLGYYSWGSNDRAITRRHFGFGFVPGAIAGMFVSSDGRTFSEPPAAWTLGTWDDKATYFAGSPQSLAGDLIREGVTGVAGHVEEPYLDGTIRPDILFPAYLTGFNLAESFYLAMRYVSWQTVVVGDPLCAPFPRKMLQPSDIDKGIDPDTELPAVFAARRLRVLTVQGAQPEAAKAMLRSEARTAKGDKAGARKALEEATTLDPRLVAAHLQLALGYEEEKEYDKAIGRYRAIVAVDPNDAVALNNLAYALAVRKGQPAGAVEYAERAYRLTGGRSVEIADTLAWVQHLVGRDREALQLLEQVVMAAPAGAEYRLHLAVVYAALGRLAEASTELREAVRLAPELEKSAEVAALRAKLKQVPFSCSPSQFAAGGTVLANAGVRQSGPYGDPYGTLVR
jgi:uncharacterized protein (TIGR03790 family)